MALVVIVLPMSAEKETFGLTALLAVWGAILSTVALIWNFVRDSTDRGKLEVSGMIGKFAPGDDPRSYLVVTITNVGRRPVFVKGWGGKYKKPVQGKVNFFITAQSPEDAW